MNLRRSFLATAAMLLAARCLAAPSGLDRHGADEAIARLWNERREALRAERGEEFKARALAVAGKTLRWKERAFGTAPASGPSLWISLHGGGGAPPAVNDRQWTNQIRLYQPAEGIYVAPRAPTDTWNLWHEGHIDPMFDRLIEDYVALRGVDPNRVYVLGYSAGGDGVWQLGPRMADRWAAAAMMAGHPNSASLLSLRNLPFAIFVGGADDAYNRNKVVAERAAQLDQLEKADPGGYPHMSRVYPGMPHWMGGKDAEAIPWMAKRTRDPWPKKIVWLQEGPAHTRFYWLSIPADAAKGGKRIDATVDGQTVRLTGDVPDGTELRLSDKLLDLDRTVTVFVGDRRVFEGSVPRTDEAIRRSLAERGDPPGAATALLRLKL